MRIIQPNCSYSVILKEQDVLTLFSRRQDQASSCLERSWMTQTVSFIICCHYSTRAQLTPETNDTSVFQDANLISTRALLQYITVSILPKTLVLVCYLFANIIDGFSLLYLYIYSHIIMHFKTFYVVLYIFMQIFLHVFLTQLISKLIHISAGSGATRSYCNKVI